MRYAHGGHATKVRSGDDNINDICMHLFYAQKTVLSRGAPEFEFHDNNGNITITKTQS